MLLVKESSGVYVLDIEGVIAVASCNCRTPRLAHIIHIAVIQLHTSSPGPIASNKMISGGGFSVLLAILYENSNRKVFMVQRLPI